MSWVEVRSDMITREGRGDISKVYILVSSSNFVQIETGRLDQWLTPWSEAIQSLSAITLKRTQPENTGVFQFDSRIGFLRFFPFFPLLLWVLPWGFTVSNLLSLITISLLDVARNDISFVPIRLIITRPYPDSLLIIISFCLIITLGIDCSGSPYLPDLKLRHLPSP